MRSRRRGERRLRGAGLFALFFLTMALFPRAARAQEVRSDAQGVGAVRRRADAAADKQGRGDWPRVTDGETGTQIHVTFDFRNADVILITGSEFGLPALLETAQGTARRLALPQTDFITVQGRSTVAVDMEFNDYLQRTATRRTDFDLDLHALAAALNASRLPRPRILAIHSENADHATLQSETGSAVQVLGEKITFLSSEEIRPGARLRFQASITWRNTVAAVVVALFFGVAFLGSLGMAAWMPWRLARFREKQRRAALETAPTAPDSQATFAPQATLAPEEVQRRYDRGKPLWIGTLLPPLLILGVSLLGNPARLFDAAFRVLPTSPFSSRAGLLFPLALMATFALSSLACAWNERRRRGGNDAPEVQGDPDTPPTWTQMGWLLPMAAGMTLMPLVLFIPALRRLEVPQRLGVVFGIEALAFVSAALIALRGSRANRTPLREGDPWYALVQETAARAAVRVRHVVRIRSTSLNATASIFGTVGLTSALLRKMEPDEVRAVIAHEIGHLRAGHARRNFVVSLAALAVFIALWQGGLWLARGRVPEFTYRLLQGPLIGAFVLPVLLNLVLGRGQRQREMAADRFAVEATGDPELVIRALTKLHTLNASPHTLKPGDEALSSHPSLARRIEAIRSAARNA